MSGGIHGEITALKILVACEFSGRVRDALIAQGHDAISCDMLPSEAPGPHIQGDVLPLLSEPWDMVIAHPPCTYLANSGVRWRVERQEWAEVKAAGDFFLACLNANAPCVAVENPVMHKYGREVIGRGPDFTVQPWQFGDNERKRTCFWTRGLPPLVATSSLDGTTAGTSIHREAPGPDRKRNRSRTFPGIADAIAQQWAGTKHQRRGFNPPRLTALQPGGAAGGAATSLSLARLSDFAPATPARINAVIGSAPGGSFEVAT